MIGTTVGSYRIVSKLSTGGMGTVYRAEHTLIGKLAAVKVLHTELSTSTDIVNRFFNEAKATTTIKHPGIVEVFDFGYLEDGHAYIVMEFLEGMSLARRCKTKGPMNEGEAAMLLRGVCSALQAAHNRGIVHRDLKPDNIFVVPDADAALGERPKLLDFGIAKLKDIGLAATATKTGAVMGTPMYMSPEQCRGTGELDHRADLYSIGCIYYELLTGQPPFVGLAAGELIGAHLFLDPEPPSRHLASITPETEALIMSLLAKDPDKRPQSAKLLGQQLTQIAQQHGWISAATPNGVTALDVEPARPHSSSDAALDTIASTPAPTTLSGAASQSVIDRAGRASRRRLSIAFISAAVVLGGVVALIKNGASSAASTTASPSPRPVAMPSPEPPPTQAPAPAPTPPAPEPVAAPPPSAPVATPVPVSKPRPVVKKATPHAKISATAATPPVVKKKKPLIENDIE